MIDIYIPSYKRPSAPLIRKFAEAGIAFVIVLDHEEDRAQYEKYLSDKVGILFIPEAKGIGYIRQKIKERYEGRPVMMMDDDTTLGIRDPENPIKINTCKTPEEVRRWVEIVDVFCSRYRFDLGGVADGIWKWDNPSKVLRSGSLCSVTIFNSWRCQEITYDPALYKRMEDWDYVLQAITKRHEFLICNEVVRHCPMNKAAKDVGGCSEVYRDDKAMMTTTSYLLQKWGRDIVKLSKTKKIGNCNDFTVDCKAMRKRYGYKY